MRLIIIAAGAMVLAGGVVLAQERDGRAPELVRGAHQWVRGRNLPNLYFSKQFAVSDWRQHNLRDPGENGRWVRDEDGNCILVSLGTRMIEDIVTAGNHP